MHVPCNLWYPPRRHLLQPRKLLPGASEELSGELIVFAAASLTDVFSEIATDFQAQHPDTTIVYNFAGSQQLAQQLGQGAPADLFASANGTLNECGN